MAFLDFNGLTTFLNELKGIFATKNTATTSDAGLMSSEDKEKLDGIASGANNYVHPTNSGNKHIPSGGSDGKILGWKADGEAQWVDDKGTTYNPATQDEDGLMSAEDKVKLDGIEENANNYVHPTSAGNKHIPSGGSSGQILKWSQSGTAVWANETDTTYDAAGAELGLVKSGGDVNISDGIITIKDDSHTHVIGNIDGLQTALDNKLDADANAVSASKLANGRTFSITGGATASGVSFDGTGNVSLNVTALDPSRISGTIPIDKLPAGALERLVKVANEDARFALTTSEVQLGDTVQQLDTGLMYIVIDTSKLNSEEGYQVYTAGSASSVPWSGITGRPETFTPSAHTHTRSQITDFPSSLKNPTSIKIQLNGGTTEGTNQFTYDGSNAKTLNITASKVGAASTSHDHEIADVTGLQTALNGKLSTGGTAAKATADSLGQNISDTYIKALSVSGKVITYTRGDDTTGTITTQDTNTTYGAAGTNLGLVKSGGDVTISNGVITVNDDSHAHTISNIDGLQSALDGKLGTSANAASATKLATPRNINGMSFDGTVNRFNYGTCSTAAGTAAKTVSCSGFSLATGSEITVKFTVTNTAANPTLNVNSTGAKAIYYNGASISAGYLKANKTYSFRYNGTQYDLVGDVDTNTTYSLSSLGVTATAAELNKLDGLATTKTELGYLDGVTSNVQTQLNNKLSVTGTASKAKADASGQNIADTYIKGLSVSGRTITYTKGDGSTGTIQTQDTNTTYSTFKAATSSAGGGAGLVPAPAAGENDEYLRGDGTWATPPNTTYSNMSGASSSAAGKSGLVPAPSAGAANRYLRSDGTWAVPPDTNTTYTLSSFGITANKNEINKLDGLAVTKTELGYLDGVTSNVQTQLNGKLGTSGTAAKATSDASGQNIASTYIKAISKSNHKLTLTKGNGTTSTITLDYDFDGGSASTPASSYTN